MLALQVTLFLTVGFYGSTSFITRTHFYVDQEMNWTEAQLYCRLHYYDLSTISSREENDQMPVTKNLCSRYASNNECRFESWIGLYTNSNDLSDWMWSGGEDVVFSMWADGNADESQTATCAYYNLKNSKWYADSCSLNLTFFCMEETSQFVLVQSNKTWQEALDYCRNNYSELVSLLSDEENALAVRISQAAETAHVWTGLHFVVKYWVWVSGNALEYQAWSDEGPPKCPARNYSCGALETKKKVWQSRDCEEKLNFLCLIK